MLKIKEIKLKTIEEILNKQDELLEQNEDYTFRIIPTFLNGYCLEVYQSKRENLYNLLNGFYESFRLEVERLETINNMEQK